MGGQSSKATIDSLNERITEIAMRSVSSCSATTEQEQNQTVNISGFFSWGDTITAKQTAKVNTQCLQSDSLINDLQNQVINTIGSSVSADGVALLPAFGNTTTEQVVNLKNIIRTSLSKENIVNNYNKAIQKQAQTINLGTIIRFGTTISAVNEAEAFAEAIINSLVDSKVMSAVQDHLELQAKASSNNPLDIIGRAFSSVFGGIATVLGAGAGTVMFVVFIIMIVIIGGIFMLGKFGLRDVLKGVGARVAGPQIPTINTQNKPPNKPPNKPAQEQPVVDQPPQEQPVVNQPVVNQPLVDQPVVNQPVVDQPV